MTGHTLELRYANSRTASYKGKDISLAHYDVILDGEKIGQVWRGMATHERRTPGNRYANARWQSPAWFWTDGWDVPSRREALERMLRNLPQIDNWTLAEKLAASVRNVR